MAYTTLICLMIYVKGCLSDTCTVKCLFEVYKIAIDPPNGPVLFCWLASVVVVICNAAVGRAGRQPGMKTVGAPATGRVGGQHCTAGQSCYVPLGRHLVLLGVLLCKLSYNK